MESDKTETCGVRENIPMWCLVESIQNRERDPDQMSPVQCSKPRLDQFSQINNKAFPQEDVRFSMG
jgi:hypothetical protein